MRDTLNEGERSGEDRVSIHKIFLPVGLLLLAMGLWSIRNYFVLKGPPASELQELRLRDVTNVTAVEKDPGSRWPIRLEASNGLKMVYQHNFPYADEVKARNTNYSLLLDSTNTVWAVKSAEGQEHARSYFEEYNIEAKSVGKVCGTFIAIVGAVLLLMYFLIEKKGALSTSGERAKLEVDGVKFRVAVGLFIWMFVYGWGVMRLLSPYVPKVLLSFGWLVTAFFVMKFLGPKRRPKV